VGHFLAHFWDFFLDNNTWKSRKATMDELWEAAKVCRVANVMRPYLEAITFPL